VVCWLTRIYPCDARSNLLGELANVTDQLTWKTRELEILELLAQGLTNSEIGARLHLAQDTVRWYNKHLFEKLGVNKRLQAVNRAAELGLLPDSGPAPVIKTGPAAPRAAVQYVANGAVHIAYQVIGHGPVDLLFIHGFLSHLELAWENPEFTNFFEQLGRTARVILFDKRGMGLSDRIQGAPTLENTIEDACCVLNAAGSRHAFVMGTSEGGAAAVLLAATYPERVLGLILYAAVPKVVRTDNEPAWAVPEDQFDRSLERLQKTWGSPWAVERFAPSRAHDTWFRDWWAKILRAASSPSSIQAVLSLVRAVDIRPLLRQIQVKSLVIHKTDDLIASVEAGRYFAAHMPRARWMELPGADHIYFVESAALISAVTQFCQEKATHGGVDTRIAIILYALTNEAGMAAKGLQTHLHTCGPRHTTSTTTAVMALFDSPTRAIHCALQLRSQAKPEPIRISLHVGACYVLNGQPLESVLGIAKHAAELIDPAEIVVTRTLHDILAGTSFVFQERNQPLPSDAPENISLFTLI
jgi:pimeloyl-ACP methyl ester carboxylesterase/DNA-binding CsgD family transcriptional regulator